MLLKNKCVPKTTSCLISLHIDLSVWNNSSYGLYNFKSKKEEILNQKFCLSSDRVFLCSKTTKDFFFTQENVSNNLDSAFVGFKISLDSNNITKNAISVLKKKENYSGLIWSVVEEKFPSTKRPLKEGDFLRFGKQIVQIQKMQIEKKNEKLKKQVPSFPNLSESHQLRSQSNLMCRICLECETPSRLFEPLLCCCSNSMPAHMDCLINWIESKCIKRLSFGAMIVDHSCYFCDICKQKYPRTVEYKNELIDLLDYQSKYKERFIILDFFSINENTLQQSIVFDLNGKNDIFLNVGRQKESCIFLRDISVSRNHAKFWVYHDRLYVYDCKSKFGTGVGVLDKFILMDNKRHKFMIDKCFLTLKIVNRDEKCAKSSSHNNQYTKNPSASFDLIAEFMNSLMIRDYSSTDPKVTEEPQVQVDQNIVTNQLPANLEESVDKKPSEEKHDSAILHEITPRKINKVREKQSEQKNNLTLNLGDDNELENSSQSNRKRFGKRSALLRKINLIIQEKQISNPSSLFFDPKDSRQIEINDKSDFYFKANKDSDSVALLADNSSLVNYRSESKESCIYDAGFSSQNLFRFE